MSAVPARSLHRYKRQPSADSQVGPSFASELTDSTTTGAPNGSAVDARVATKTFDPASDAARSERNSSVSPSALITGSPSASGVASSAMTVGAENSTPLRVAR